MFSDLDKIKNRIQKAVLSRKELDEGWLFGFDPTLDHDDLETFITHEQECCSFLKFSINFDNQRIWCKVERKSGMDYDLETVKEIILALFSSN